MKYALFLFLLMFSVCSALPAELGTMLSAGEKIAPYWIDGTDALLKMAEPYANLPIEPAVREKPMRAIGDTEKFWTTIVTNNSFEEIEAKLVAIGKHCYIYVTLDQNVSSTVIENLKNSFDNVIYPKDTSTFGVEPNPGIDFDERITLLLLDIKDGWEPGKGYVGGYFFPLNEYSKRIFQYSNEREMFYIDTYPNDPASDFTYSIIAHEFQHMIHWNQDSKEKIWFNEACSQYAMWHCGYGHGNQIFATIMNPELNLTAWAKDVMIENYGMVYLWNYYLFRKYGGNTEKDIQTFIKNLVADQNVSMDAIQSALGFTSVEDIFTDFSITNFVNNMKNGQKYSYDETLTMTLHPSHTHSSLPVSETEEKVLQWSADCIEFVSEAPYLPVNPTLIDKITFSAEKPGKLYWGVNSWQTPDSSYIPSRDTVLRFGVETKLIKNDTGTFTCVLGPFRKGVKNLDFIFKYDDNTVSREYSVPVVQSTLGYRAAQGTELSIKFDGDKPWFGSPKFRVYAVKTDTLSKDASVIEKISLDSDFDATVKISGFGTLYNNVKLIVINTDGKSEQKYTYEASLAKEKPEIMLKNLDTLVKKAEAVRQDENSYLKIIDRIKLQADILEDSGMLQEAAQYRTLLTSIKDNDSDTSHTNIMYLISKKQELIDALTHLKIDPVWLEGQIQQMLTLLEINLHFPHIPFPNGLALVNYKESAAEKYLEKLKKQHTDHDKEILKRLTIAEGMMEIGYNTSLTMAEDMSAGLYKTGLLFFNAKKSVEFVLSHIENVPVLGDAAGYLKKKLVEKITIAANKVIKLAAAKLPSPYSTIVPIASDIICRIIYHFQDIDPEDTSSVGTMKNVVIKTAGKYVLSSLPKIGFVPSTQKYIDEACVKANTGSIEGTYAEALSTVMEGNSSLASKLVVNASQTHAKIHKEWEIADISDAVSNVSQYTSLIDPTAVSKVITILGKVISGGLMGHSIYIAGREYYVNIPEMMHTGVAHSYYPGRVYDFSEPAEKYDVSRTNIEDFARMFSETAYTVENTLKSYSVHFERGDFSGVDSSVKELGDSLSAYEDCLEIAAAYVSASTLRSKADEFIELSSNTTAQSMNLYAETFTYFLNNGKNRSDLLGIVQNLRKTVSESRRFIENNLRFIESTSKSLVIVGVDYPQWVQPGEKFAVNYTLQNCSSAVLEDVSVKFGAGRYCKVRGKDSITIRRINPYVSIPMTVYFEADRNISGKFTDMSIIADYGGMYDTEYFSSKIK